MPKITWEEIVAKFDKIEAKLTTNFYDGAIENFFEEIMQDFSQQSFEKWQVEEAKARMNHIIQLLKEVKDRLEEEKISLIENTPKLKKYMNQA